jgi:hypothetical protein
MEYDIEMSGRLEKDVYRLVTHCPDCGGTMYFSSTLHVFCGVNTYFGGDCDYYSKVNGLQMAKLMLTHKKLFDNG